MYVCEECGTEDDVRMVHNDDDMFPLCKGCATDAGLAECTWTLA